MKRLEKYEGRPLRQRMEAAFIAGGRLAVAPMRRAAPRVSGKLSSKVSDPQGPTDRRATSSASAPSHGHRTPDSSQPVTASSRRAGAAPANAPRPTHSSRRVIGSYEGRIIRFISDAVAKEGISAFGSMGGF